ncbi:MAG: hypothetical protein E7Z87_05950 [Cyanobacteria bacterium SIG26]|nr:hypothetical protein [Cyanobacteria bacterium SIG26]
MIRGVVPYTVQSVTYNVSFNANPVSKVSNSIKALSVSDSAIKKVEKESFASRLKNVLTELFPILDIEYRNLFKVAKSKITNTKLSQ